MNKRRKLKQDLPAKLLQKLRNKTKGYGRVIEVCQYTGLNYANFHQIVTTGRATPENIAKVSEALKQIEA